MGQADRAEIGIDRTQAQRAVKIASISEEAKTAAREAGIDGNQSTLLKIAKVERSQQAQVAQQFIDLDRAAKTVDRPVDQS